MSAPQKTIGGRLFSFGMLPPADAIRVEVAIMRVIGEPVFKAFVKAQDLQEEKKLKGLADLRADASAIAMLTAEATAAVGLIASRMDAEELIATMRKVFAVVQCEGKPVDLDVTFTGRNKDVWLVFVEGLRVNFSAFFPGGLSTSTPGDALPA